MKVALYGSTGKAGSRILKELLSRDHRVTAIARNPAKLEGVAGVTTKEDDLADVNRTAEAIRGVDAVISAYGPPQDNTDEIVEVTRRQVEAVKRAGNPRLLVVGGAGGLAGCIQADCKLTCTSLERTRDIGRRLDLPRTGGLLRAGRANRQIPARQERTHCR